ncbi:hypothetical protein SBADM41S_06860 [Streptomyces badius]
MSTCRLRALSWTRPKATEDECCDRGQRSTEVCRILKIHRATLTHRSDRPMLGFRSYNRMGSAVVRDH